MFASSGFVIYRALALRRVLVDSQYRTRALWTAIGASSVIVFLLAEYVDLIFGSRPTTIAGVLVEGIIWGFVFLPLYGWVVSNVDVAISADYFNRDALSWRKGGRIVTSLIILIAYLSASLPPWWMPKYLESGAGSNIIFVMFVAVTLYPAAVLAITYRRINDKRIKIYTLWLVLSILSLLVLFTLPSWVFILPAVTWAFFMYRSVDSLAIKVHHLASA